MLSGGCDEICCVNPVFTTGRHLPAGRFLGVVASFAFTQTVFGAGRPVAVVRLGVVAVPDRRVTVRCATGLVAQPDERGQPPRKHLDRDSIATRAPVAGRDTAAAASPVTGCRSRHHRPTGERPQPEWARIH
jgi:hypothetical protein